MSLHAQLSPEAQTLLATQQRTSTITSILISLLTILLIGIGLLYLLLDPIPNFAPDIATYTGDHREKPDTPKPKTNHNVQRKPSPPSHTSNKLVIANTPSNIFLPISDIDTPEPTLDLGSGDDDGQYDNANGSDSGTNYTRIHKTLRNRCSLENRLERLTLNGGNPECEKAVVQSLRWLKKTQNPDGSWTPNKKTSMTGFALLAFLGHCETPDSEEFGDAVTRAIIYLINVGMKQNGKLADDIKDKHWPYEHAIATYALAEATTFAKHIPQLTETTKAAGDWILQHQHNSGSWDYAYDMSGNRGGDTSIALWHIQALKACKHTDLWEKNTFKTCIKNALTYLRSKQNPSGGVGYTSASPNGKPGYTMTGGAILAFQIWGKSHSPLVKKGTAYITKNTRLDYNTEHADLYRHYYHVQAMINRGGDNWKSYNALFRDQLLHNQNSDGSYKNVGGGSKIKAIAPSYQGSSPMAIHYRTCLATFMLEAYYRFLPSTGQNRNH